MGRLAVLSTTGCAVFALGCNGLVESNEDQAQTSYELALGMLDGQAPADPAACCGLTEVVTELKATSLCDVLRPLYDSTLVSQAKRAAFFIGAQFEAEKEVGGVVGGEVVWDLYDHDAAVFTYWGYAASGRTINVEVNAYFGAGWGLDEGVKSWERDYVWIGGSWSPLPAVKLGPTINGQCMVSAGDHPLGDIVACSLGAGFGFKIDFVSVMFPFGISPDAGLAHWKRHPGATKVLAWKDGWLGGRYEDGRVLYDRVTGGPNGQLADYPHTEKNLWLAGSILTLVGPNPLTIQAAQNAVAIGMLRDWEDRGYPALCAP